MKIDAEKCKGCGWCAKDCPVEAITMVDKKASLDDGRCVGCRVCFRVCRYEAVTMEPVSLERTVECDHCPIKCRISDGNLGACRRYKQERGEIFRLEKALTCGDVREYIIPRPKEALREPVVTAIGVGTTYPDCRPAPAIVRETRGNVDVVTVATEVPLSYSSCIVKIDTDVHLGEQGAAIVYDGREVGMLETEQYGSKMLHIGGVNRFTSGPAGFAAVRAVTEIINHKPIKLRVKDGARLELQIGQPPVINGVAGKKMRVGCGSATTGIFASLFVEAADEVLVLDSHITGQLSRHVAGQTAGAKPTGVEVIFPMSTPGRYFGDHGEGWGGTSITDPKKLIKSIDMKVAWPSMTILVTETTGQNGTLFEVTADGGLTEIDMRPAAQAALNAIRETCEPSMVSAIYTAGSGGSARAGVCRYPIKLTQAVHQNKVVVSLGGVPAFVLPGGGITFFVDAGQIKPGSFSWTPTPATICPLEYTMEVKDYEAMGGHVEAMKPFPAQQPASQYPGTWLSQKDDYAVGEMDAAGKKGGGQWPGSME
ncbi:MAG: 4Fe-4S binding protein [Candidatus Adiutrix sp.]|jgi:Pyruvate/2-oxoacid:ferredoxin oxidoreductase delta subunit|nr:4Fe-4S binding protein [Candidatus Adiutrix sp.]